MKILVTGANGYIGSRLIPRLIENNHFVYAMVRNHLRYSPPTEDPEKIKIIDGDFLDPLTLHELPHDIDVAYYFIHSMTNDAKHFDLKDRIIAENFTEALEKTQCKQVVYLSGIVNDSNLSKHLNSRYEVEKILKESRIPLTSLRSAIIIGAGSASFEIIRDLTEKLPVMIAPKWLKSKCQPIGVTDVVDYLSKVISHKDCIGKSFDVGGPDILSYKDMLLGYAKVRHLKRWIFIVPVLTPGLSSRWLFFITATSYYLARTLVHSLSNNAVCKDFSIQKIIPKECLGYEASIQAAFKRIENHEVISSWKDSWSSSDFPAKYKQYVKLPTHGCLFYHVEGPIKDKDPKKLMNVMCQLGGNNGYYVNWAWKVRGFIDRMVGGVGLRRGRVARETIRPGDALDFWRVLLVDNEKYRLLLYAEMKVPGEAWLEFKIEDKHLKITATFRPSGLCGRFYWVVLWPIHFVIFRGLLKRILKKPLP